MKDTFCEYLPAMRIRVSKGVTQSNTKKFELWCCNCFETSIQNCFETSIIKLVAKHSSIHYSGIHIKAATKILNSGFQIPCFQIVASMLFPEKPVSFFGSDHGGPWNVHDVEQCRDWSTSGTILPENFGVIGIVLSITHSLANTPTQTTFIGPRSGPGTGPNSRMRLQQQKSRTYDRIVLFGDLASTSGNCFAVVFQSNSASAGFFSSSKQQKGVGWMYYIYEPKVVKETLGSTESVPILEDYTDAYVLTNEISESVREIPFSQPDAGHTKFFAYHNKTIKLTHVTVKNDTCMSAYFCDRQKVFMTSSGKAHCGCFSNVTHVPLVLNSTLDVSIPDINNEQHGLIINNYRSFRTQQLFIESKDLRAASQTGQSHGLNCIGISEAKRLRSAVNACINYINGHGGWTVIGWIRRGITIDQSDATENIASLHTDPHVSYLLPSNPNAATGNEYKALMYKPPVHGNLNEDQVCEPH
jgi:hypothetical protein